MVRPIAPAVALAAVAWMALLVAAPLLPVPAAALLYAAGSLICHQISERSFHVHMFQLPVCARCLGLYAGGELGCVAAAVRVVGPAVTRRPLLAGSGRYALTVIAALPTVVTFLLEWVGGWHISNATRALAGVPLGFAVAFVVVSAHATLHYSQCAPRRATGRDRASATNF